jgi:hypothetical protein
MLSSGASQRAVAETGPAAPSLVAPRPQVTNPEVGDLYLPQLDPNADLCQG